VHSALKNHREKERRCLFEAMLLYPYVVACAVEFFDLFEISFQH
jgi:hypothetical protein